MAHCEGLTAVLQKSGTRHHHESVSSTQPIFLRPLLTLPSDSILGVLRHYFLCMFTSEIAKYFIKILCCRRLHTLQSKDSLETYVFALPCSICAFSLHRSLHSLVPSSCVYAIICSTPSPGLHLLHFYSFTRLPPSVCTVTIFRASVITQHTARLPLI